MKRIDIVYGEKVRLDAKDKKILSALYQDGRMPVSKIAKKTGLKRDSIVYRIKRMIKNDIISFIRPTLNPAKIGFPLIIAVTIESQNYHQFTIARHVNILLIRMISNFLKIHTQTKATFA